MNSRISNTFLLFLLIPSFAEIINYSKFSFAIPHFPLSLGRLFFVIAGIISFAVFGFSGLKTRTFKGFALVSSGCLLGSLFSDYMQYESFTRAFGLSILLLGSVGISNLWEQAYFKRTLLVFFLVCFLYWTIVVLKQIFIDSTMISYADLYSNRDVVNHHIVGLITCISSIFVSLYLYYKSGRLEIYGYFIIFISVFVIFLTESRSNLLISVFVLFLIMATGLKRNKFGIILFAIFIIAVSYTFGILMDQSEQLFIRFNTHNLDYQKRTTEYRLNYITVALTKFIANPMGQGIRDAEVTFRGRTQQVHNQYLTFMLSGGIFAAIGLYIWLSTLFKYSIKILFKKHLLLNNFVYASLFTVITFILTLISIEWVDLLFFIIVSLSIFLEKQLNDEYNTLYK